MKTWRIWENEPHASSPNLAEVARIVRANPSDHAMPLDEFDLDHPDKAAKQRRLDPVPEPVGGPPADACIPGGWGHEREAAK